MKSKISIASLGGPGELQQQSEQVNSDFPTYTELMAGKGKAGVGSCMARDTSRAGARCHLGSAPPWALTAHWGQAQGHCCDILPVLPQDGGHRVISLQG